MKKVNLRKILVVGCVLCLVLFGGGYLAYRAYLSARQTHLVKQAEQYLAKPDFRKALLCLQRVLRSNPKNVEACRLMAVISEAGRTPEALIWRSRVVELNPRSLDDRLALAQTAMVFGDYATATNTLQELDAAGKKTAAYHNIAGEAASTLGQLAQAEAHFLEAARLEPTNFVPQLNLAVVRLHGTNATALAEARASLKHIAAADSRLRCQALRELVVDSMRFRQTNSAVELSRELGQQTNSTFSDQLLRLDVLKATQNTGFKAALAATQRDAATNTALIAQLGEWQMTRTGPTETMAWLRSLPVSTQTNQAVALAIAECLTMAKDWQALQNSLAKQNWAGLEFLRHAFLTRARREQGFEAAAIAEWELALQTAGGQKASLVMLLRLAADWKWQSEVEKLLWAIVNNFPGEKSALQALTQVLYVGGRTQPLLQLFKQESKRAPSDLDMKNNLAMTSLLLGAQELKPHELAREVYQASPTNAAYAATYAFSLYLQGKTTEALKIFQTLKPQDLEQPANAGYYGLVLKASGDKAKARSYLNWAFKGFMLPEEKKLFEQARAGL